MSSFRRDGGPGRGFFPADHTAWVWSRNATPVVLGDILMLDYAQGDHITPGAAIGADDSVFANAIVPAIDANFPLIRRHCVVIDTGQSAGAVDTLVRVATKGVYDVRIDTTTALGTHVVEVQASNIGKVVTAAGGAVGAMIVGIPLEVVSTTVETVCECWFDGEGGFGAPIT